VVTIIKQFVSTYISALAKSNSIILALLRQSILMKMQFSDP